MCISDIQSDIRAIEAYKAIYKATNFNRRAEAIDFLDFHVLERIEGLTPNKELELIRIQATSLKEELEKIDINLFQHLKEQLRRATDKKSCIEMIMLEYLQLRINEVSSSRKIGYETLDVFINELFASGPAPAPTKSPEPEMVFYQKTPARTVVEMIAGLTQDDVFFDLGSGLGQVVNLVNILSEAKATGIEYEPAYCEYAKQSALQLGLTTVNFINEDARKSDYSSGTVFFMYTPFEGKMLEDVMALLQKVAQKRSIRIFAYGPCAFFLTQLSWLNGVKMEVSTGYELYEFRSE